MMTCRKHRGDSPGIGQGVAVKGAGGINPDPLDPRMAGQSGDLSLCYFAHGADHRQQRPGRIPAQIARQRLADPRRAHQQRLPRAAGYRGDNLIQLLVFFGISYGALRISGGFVVGIIGYQMLFGSRDQGGAPVVRRDKDDYSFFPIAMPGISGPGTIAVVIGIASEIAELPNVMDMAGAFFMTGVAIVLTCAVTWIVLRSADYISGRLGPSGTAVLTKLMGFLLICIGVQFIGSGIRTFIAGS